MRRLFLVLFLALGLPSAARAADPAACHTVRLADVGWTDASAVTAVAAEMFDALGYATTTPMVTLSVAYLSMKSGQIDAFLSNWNPTGVTAIAPYLKDGSVKQIAVNLSGGHFTLGVPDYVAAQGLRDFKDIEAWGPKLHRVIYGLESGNDGNAMILKMIKNNDFGLQHFRLVESSEQGMLSQVSRSIDSHRPIVFLAWEPHPMNIDYRITYLTGGERIFGAGAYVDTVTRASYETACPNAYRFLSQIRFSVQDENILMKAVQDDHIPPRREARDWLRTHPDVFGPWLKDVTTFDGQPPLDAVRNHLGIH
ncbi:glycine betaine ABC transporter substrate-binding protein [Komagataeibacter sp. FNDCF1]|uniref:glycine betaine ABC transporter substrate-binding protein n=1 Tax=Komagataeibacter sp. FNDCF1 TaxID=2878681 RepID=UPI001E5CAF8F|nr:glycine betaine ABC transporter substrate-binding protein [Komagataeibacter sp. FNDCF1]MCE2565146.1 glycine/betaine ABC transporter substrate-binding protein [Komagataeibacter sp. FNDCF1]